MSARPRKDALRPKTRRWPFVVGGLVALVIGIVVSLTLHQSSPTGSHNVFGGPSPTQAHSPLSAGSPTGPTDQPTNKPGPAPLPPVQTAQVDTVVKNFIHAAFSMRYDDPPNAAAARVKPYTTAHFTGYLPTMPSPNSNAGLAYTQNHTVSRAQVDADADIKIEGVGPTSMLVEVTYTQTTQDDTAKTHWDTLTRVLTLAKVGPEWLVSSLADGGYSP